MEWWLDRMPHGEAAPRARPPSSYQRQQPRRSPAAEAAPDPETTDRVMLLRPRKSRIYFLRKFFDYPIQLSADTVRKLGLVRMARIGLSYLRAMAFPFRPPKNLEEFFINRFGRELYRTFFKSYTEKVWGERARRSAPSGAPSGSRACRSSARCGISLRKLFRRGARRRPERHRDLADRAVPLSEARAGADVGDGGRRGRGPRRQDRPSPARRSRSTSKGTASRRSTPSIPAPAPSRPTAATTSSRPCPSATWWPRWLPPCPPTCARSAEGLVYRDFITVGLLLSELKVRDDAAGPSGSSATTGSTSRSPTSGSGDCRSSTTGARTWWPTARRSGSGWNTSATRRTTCGRWPTQDLIALAAEELARIGIIEPLGRAGRHGDPHAEDLSGLLRHLRPLRRDSRSTSTGFANLFLVGRNGMHRYNNQDHSMLTAMVAVDNILAGRTRQGEHLGREHRAGLPRGEAGDVSVSQSPRTGSGGSWSRSGGRDSDRAPSAPPL